MNVRFGYKLGVALAVAALTSGTLAVRAQQGSAGGKSYPKGFPRPGATEIIPAENLGGVLHDLIDFWNIQRDRAKPSQMYQLANDTLTVAITPGAYRLTRPDGTWAIHNDKLATIRVEVKGTIQKEEGLEDVASRAVAFELQPKIPESFKQEPTAALYPPQFPRIDCELLAETDTLRVWQQRWLPERPVTIHSHYNEAAAVYVGEGELKSRNWVTGGKAAEWSKGGNMRHIGHVLFHRAERPGSKGYGAHHDEGWVSGEPSAIWVELKSTPCMTGFHGTIGDKKPC